jgi:carbon storage regulator
MLVLSRKIGDRIVIGETIEITVMQIRGNIVRLGVTAPRHIHVGRVDLQVRRANLGLADGGESLEGQGKLST